MGSPNYELDLTNKPELNYRQKPTHDWEMDSQKFYYFRLHDELPYTNLTRTLKENIYSYSLSTKLNSKIEIFSNGKLAARFDKINNQNSLIANDLWDYNSLLWGNYFKQIKLDKEFRGNVVFRLN